MLLLQWYLLSHYQKTPYDLEPSRRKHWRFSCVKSALAKIFIIMGWSVFTFSNAWSQDFESHRVGLYLRGLSWASRRWRSWVLRTAWRRGWWEWILCRASAAPPHERYGRTRAGCYCTWPSTTTHQKSLHPVCPTVQEASRWFKYDKTSITISQNNYKSKCSLTEFTPLTIFCCLGRTSIPTALENLDLFLKIVISSTPGN